MITKIILYFVVFLVVARLVFYFFSTFYGIKLEWVNEVYRHLLEAGLLFIAYKYLQLVKARKN